MELLILFISGLIVGIAISQIQRTKEQGPFVDIIFGIMGATIIGGMVSQLTKFNPVIVVLAILGAVLFIEIERTVPNT